MNILVTGAAGYIGTVLCDWLLRDGHKVTGFDNLSRGGYGLRALCSDPNFSFISADVREMGLHSIKSYDALIPLAGIVGQGACNRRFQDATYINYHAVRDLVKRKGKDQILIYPMTNSGYGNTDPATVCTEDSPLNPVSHYGMTKKNAEDVVLQYDGVVSLRLATVFGMSPNMRWDLLVNDFVKRAVTDRTIVVFEGKARRNFVHVRDVVECVSWMLYPPCRQFYALSHKVYNLGNDSLNATKIKLASIVADFVGNGTYVHEAEVGSDPDKRDYIVSSKRLADEGFVAERGLAEGVAELVKGVSLDN